MSSIALKLIGICAALLVASSGLARAVPSTSQGGYPLIVRIVAGVAAIFGSLSLARAIDRTLLRSGGARVFKAAYVAAVALAGLGVAEASGAAFALNTGMALLTYCIFAIASGTLWLRFYDLAA